MGLGRNIVKYASGEMGWAKQLKQSVEEQQMRDDCEEAQSRCRMSMLCRDAVRPLPYPLFIRIVELAVAISQDDLPSPLGARGGSGKF